MLDTKAINQPLQFNATQYSTVQYSTVQLRLPKGKVLKSGAPKLTNFAILQIITNVCKLDSIP